MMNDFAGDLVRDKLGVRSGDHNIPDAVDVLRFTGLKRCLSAPVKCNQSRRALSPTGARK